MIDFNWYKRKLWYNWQRLMKNIHHFSSKKKKKCMTTNATHSVTTPKYIILSEKEPQSDHKFRYAWMIQKKKLDHVSSDFKLRILESLYIHKRKPKLNHVSFFLYSWYAIFVLMNDPTSCWPSSRSYWSRCSLCHLQQKSSHLLRSFSVLYMLIVFVVTEGTVSMFLLDTL